MHFPMPGINRASPRQQRILDYVPALTFRSTAAPSDVVSSLDDPVNRPVDQ